MNINSVVNFSSIIFVNFMLQTLIVLKRLDFTKNQIEAIELSLKKKIIKASKAFARSGAGSCLVIKSSSIEKRKIWLFQKQPDFLIIYISVNSIKLCLNLEISDKQK